MLSTETKSTETKSRLHAKQQLTHRSNPDAVVPQQITEATQSKLEVDNEEDIDAMVPMV